MSLTKRNRHQASSYFWCRFGLFGTTSPRSWDQCSVHPVLQEVSLKVDAGSAVGRCHLCLHQFLLGMKRTDWRPINEIQIQQRWHDTRAYNVLVGPSEGPAHPKLPGGAHRTFTLPNGRSKLSIQGSWYRDSAYLVPVFRVAGTQAVFSHS